MLGGGPWIILGDYMTVRKWRPNFRPSLEKITSTLILVCLPKLPIECFNENLLIWWGTVWEDY